MKSLKPILKASYLNQREAKAKLEKKGYTYDPELSTNESKVFVDKQGNPNIAFRGSKRVTDFLIDDPLLALGLKHYKKKLKPNIINQSTHLDIH